MAVVPGGWYGGAKLTSHCCLLNPLFERTKSRLLKGFATRFLNQQTTNKCARGVKRTIPSDHDGGRETFVCCTGKKQQQLKQVSLYSSEPGNLLSRRQKQRAPEFAQCLDR